MNTQVKPKLRQKKCKGCGENFQPLRPLQMTCLKVSCALEYTRRKEEKKRRAKTREMRKEFNANDKRYQIQKTGLYCNELVRLIDSDQFCISCNEPCGDTMEAGHFLTKAAFPELRFDLRNIHGQCRACNNNSKPMRGRNQETVRFKYEGYLRERYSDDLVDWLLGPHEAKHYTLDDLKLLQTMFRAEIKYIKQHGKPSRNWRAL